MIVVSAQHGDPKAAEVIWPLHRQLNKLFEEFTSNTHCGSIEKFTIVFRVSGRVTDFGGEGPERLKRIRADNEITVDVAIPEQRWRGVSESEVRSYVASQVRSAFSQLVKRAERDKERIDANALMADFEEAMRRFESGS